MVMQAWILEPEVEFQNGGRLFLETGSSYISVMDWDISSKFGTQVDIDLSRWAKSRKPKPEVEMDI